MKKTLFLFALVAGFSAQVSAQLYSEPVQRCKREQNSKVGGFLDQGTLPMSTYFNRVTVTVRSQEVYNRAFTTGLGKGSNIDFYYDNNPSYSDFTIGALAISYKDLTKENKVVNVLAGQDVTIKCDVSGKTGYANAVMFVDWDGNGVFDDHDPNLYNLYGLTSSYVKEYNSFQVTDINPETNKLCNVTWGECGYGVNPEWTIHVPESFNTRQSVRVRVRVSESISETLTKRAGAIDATKSVVAATNDPGVKVGPMHQYFYTSNLFMFMPSGALTNGQTFDFEMSVEPDTYTPMQVTGTPDIKVQNKVGAVVCTMAAADTRKAIGNADDLKDWINDRNGIDTAYLTASFEMPATAFTAELEKGMLDGNGHTITITAGTPEISEISKDDLFFPYGLTAKDLSDNMKAYDYYGDIVDDTNYPDYHIAGGLFGKIGAGATVRNLKINYTGAATYTGASHNMIFGLIAGVVRGRIENVKVELNNNVTVQSGTYDRPWAVGGMAGVLYGGVIKGCEVDLNGSTFEVSPSGSVAATLFGESCLGGFVGRLQGGIMGNIKFSGDDAAYMKLRANGATTNTYTRYYIGGVAGMTNTPKGVFCKNDSEHQLYWGYDNGSTGMDVNNVILNYKGKMSMLSQTNSAYHNYYCRGLLFGEATDTITVPVLVVQGNHTYTVEANASDASELSGTGIPFTSRTRGVVIDHAGDEKSDQLTGQLGYVGKLYCFRDGRIPYNKEEGYGDDEFIAINVPNTELNWGFVTDRTTKADKNDPTKTQTTCNTYYMPYVVASYTGNPGTINSIKNPSIYVTNTSLADGSLGAEIIFWPPSTTTPTWEWSSENPVETEQFEPLVCFGGAEAADVIPDKINGPTTSDRTDNRYTTGVALGSDDRIDDLQSSSSPRQCYFDKRVQSGGTPFIVHQGERVQAAIHYVNNTWMHKYVYVDWNNDGYFTGDGELVAYNCLKVNGTFQNIKGDTYTNGEAGTAIPEFEIPANLQVGTYTIRFKVDWNSTDPCGRNDDTWNNDTGSKNQIGPLGGMVADYTLQVTVPLRDYCDINFANNHGPNTAYLDEVTMTSGGTQLFQDDLSLSTANNYTGRISQIENGQTLTFNAKLAPSTTDNANKFNWTSVYIFADLNCDGDFADNGERIYTARGGGGVTPPTTRPFEASLTEATAVTINKTLTFTGTGASGVRVVIAGEYYNGNPGTREYLCNDIYDNGCIDDTRLSDRPEDGGSYYCDGSTNSFHCYDYPIVIGSGDGGSGASSSANCFYNHDFGEVWEGDVKPYVMKLATAATDFVAAAPTWSESSPFTAEFNADKTELTVTYSPTVKGTHETSFEIEVVGGDIYLVELEGSAKYAPHVVFRVQQDGGGRLSRDMGYTADSTALHFPRYKGEIVTAVPVGPTAVGKWSRSEGSADGTNPFVEILNSDGQMDWQYQGDVDAVLEVNFNFKEYEGDFGNARFTDPTTRPYYIESIHSKGGLINLDADEVFLPEIELGSPHYKNLTEDKVGFQIRPVSLGEEEYTITVTMAHMENFSEDTRLMCFLDLNGNGFFDFTAPENNEGKAKNLSVNNELIFIGARKADGSKGDDFGRAYTYSESGDATNKKGEFTFKFKNTNITKYVYGRIRFIASNYVDAFGLGPVNSYGNYQPRIDNTNDGVADDKIILNDNRGKRYGTEEANRPDQCDLEAYVNAADAIFDVVKYIPVGETGVVGNGNRLRTGYIYIESIEDAGGIKSGHIAFADKDPLGSVTANTIVIKKRIYVGRWHHLSFPFDVYGTGGYESDRYNHNLKVYNTEGKIVPLSKNAWILKGFNPAERNKPGGYNQGMYDIKTKDDVTCDVLSANTFYGFAAIPVAETGGGDVDVHTESDGTQWFNVLFFGTAKNWTISGAAGSKSIPFKADCDDGQYWEKNVFTFGNPYLSPVNIQDVTSSVGWENITWWNATTQRYVGVSAANSEKMPPFYGYWVQFTESHTHNQDISVVFGNPAVSHNQNDTTYNHITVTTKSMAARIFDTPDAFTVGIDRAADGNNASAVSTTIVTLTDAGNVDEMRAGYDMPVSYAKNVNIPEIWSRAGQSRMMFNDVRREEEVTIPLGVRIKEAGEYAIRLTHTNCKDALVQLRDLQTGAMVELQREGETYNYAFLADVGDSERFELVIGAPKMTTELDVVELTDDNTEMLIYKTADMLRLQRVPLGYNVEVCDVVGREVLNTDITADDMQLQLPAAQGVYLVTVRNAQGVQQQVIKLTR